MKSAIIYVSTHHNNTAKIALAMAGVLGSDLIKPQDVSAEDIQSYDLIGLGSGIYGGKHHTSILDLADRMPDSTGTNVFIFSTAGKPNPRYHNTLKNKLKEKGYKITHEYACNGHCTYGLLKLIGGINKKRPNQEDIKRAKEFAKSLI